MKKIPTSNTSFALTNQLNLSSTYIKIQVGGTPSRRRAATVMNEIGVREIVWSHEWSVRTRVCCVYYI